MEKLGKKNENISAEGFNRRDVMKLGVSAGVAAAMPANSLAAARPEPPVPQEAAAGRPVSNAPTGGLQRGAVGKKWPEIAESQAVVSSTTVGYNVYTSSGWVNNSGRAFGNGPVDVCTDRLVKYTHSFSEADITRPSCIEAINYVILDGLACLLSGFESDVARISARVSQEMGYGPIMKSTVLGYGIVTTPEMAAFTNGTMIRHADWNDHKTDILGAILAIGEALHSTGPQVMAALALAYELTGAVPGSLGSNYTAEFDGPQLSYVAALVCGKMMGLNEDQLGNAVSLAIVPHMPLASSRVGTLTMWKGAHGSENIRNGVWAAIVARAGMTGPCKPFEGPDGVIAHTGPFTRDLRLPLSSEGLSIELTNGKGFGGLKHYAGDGSMQSSFYAGIAEPLVAWTKPEEIDTMVAEVGYLFPWQEVCDPPKWDPQNRETADHSLPYNICRHLLDRHPLPFPITYFTKEKVRDPKIRELMKKLTIHPNPSLGQSDTTLTVRKISGEQQVFKGKPFGPVTHDEILAKWTTLAEYREIDKAQADRIREQWMNLKDVKDINDAIATAAKFGKPRPLSDTSPSVI